MGDESTFLFIEVLDGLGSCGYQTLRFEVHEYDSLSGISKPKAYCSPNYADIGTLLNAHLSVTSNEDSGITQGFLSISTEKINQNGMKKNLIYGFPLTIDEADSLTLITPKSFLGYGTQPFVKLIQQNGETYVFTVS